MPMTDEKEYLSKEKLAELKQELENLTTIKRREIAHILEQAKSLGDLRENSEYQEARASQAALEERIAYLTDVVKRAVIVSAHHSSTVDIGSKVGIKKKGESEVQLFTLVGSSEANIGGGKMSNESPIGRAMMGKSKGVTFSVATARGKSEFEIVSRY